LSPTLDSTVNVGEFIPGYSKYSHITINGTTTLKSGSFKTTKLTVKGTLTLGKGNYQIDELVGDKCAKLNLERGAHVVINGIKYEGDIISSVEFTLDPFAKK
jgi:hypothetical protein